MNFVISDQILVELQAFSGLHHKILHTYIPATILNETGHSISDLQET